ncbi:hypothetical protein [Bradyrhizobium icense]|nr:hypothetical protein [Bradyrhizobium icense]
MSRTVTIPTAGIGKAIAALTIAFVKLVRRRVEDRLNRPEGDPAAPA